MSVSIATTATNGTATLRPVLTVATLADVWQALTPARGWITTAWTVIDGAGREYRSESAADSVALYRARR